MYKDQANARWPVGSTGFERFPPAQHVRIKCSNTRRLQASGK